MKSLRSQLTVALGFSICGLLVLGGLGIFFVTWGVLEDQFDDTLAAKASALISATEIDDGEFEIDLTVQNFAGFGSGGSDYFEVRRSNGLVLEASPSLRLSGVKLMPASRVPATSAARFFSGTLADGRPARFFIQRLVPQDDKMRNYQDLHLFAASPTRDLRYNLMVLGSVIAGVGALVLVITVPLLRAVLARGLRPLDKLGRQVQELPPSRLDQRLDLAGQPEELVPLGSSLNAWLGRMEASFERERRFSSHAAHELRTPLAELRMVAELGATWPDQATPERCNEMIKVVDELEALLDRLSLLARADAGSLPIDPELVDLESSLATSWARFSIAAARKNLIFTKQIEIGTFQTDPILYSTILHNLLGNAVSHAPFGSKIHLIASPAKLIISNPAPDLDPHDLEKIFDRFWRKNSSHRAEAHSGLGLSIVQACVRLLNGTIRPSLDAEGILHVEILWMELSFMQTR